MPGSQPGPAPSRGAPPPQHHRPTSSRESAQRAAEAYGPTYAYDDSIRARQIRRGLGMAEPQFDRTLAKLTSGGNGQANYHQKKKQQRGRSASRDRTKYKPRSQPPGGDFGPRFGRTSQSRAHADNNPHLQALYVGTNIAGFKLYQMHEWDGAKRRWFPIPGTRAFSPQACPLSDQGTELHDSGLLTEGEAAELVGDADIQMIGGEGGVPESKYVPAPNDAMDGVAEVDLSGQTNREPGQGEAMDVDPTKKNVDVTAHDVQNEGNVANHIVSNVVSNLVSVVARVAGGEGGADAAVVANPPARPGADANTAHAFKAPMNASASQHLPMQQNVPKGHLRQTTLLEVMSQRSSKAASEDGFVMPKRPAMIIQKVAPGPPIVTAIATPATFPSPTVAESAEESAWK